LLVDDLNGMADTEVRTLRGNGGHGGPHPTWAGL